MTVVFVESRGSRLLSSASLAAFVTLLSLKFQSSNDEDPLVNAYVASWDREVRFV